MHTYVYKRKEKIYVHILFALNLLILTAIKIITI